MLLIFLMYALTTLPLSSMLLAQASPFFLISLRMLGGGSLLLLYCCFKKIKLHISSQQMISFIQIMVFALLVPYYLRYWAIVNTSCARTELLLMSGPLITYLMATIFKLETFSRTKNIAVFIGFSGLLLYLNNPLSCYLQTPLTLADGAALLAVISFCYGWILIARLITLDNYSPLALNGITMVGAGLVALAGAATTQSIVISGSVISFMVLLSAVIIISNVFTHTLYAWLLKSYSLTFLQLASFAVPLFIDLRHAGAGLPSLNLFAFSGAVIIFMSIGLFYYTEQPYSLSYLTKFNNNPT